MSKPTYSQQVPKIGPILAKNCQIYLCNGWALHQSVYEHQGRYHDVIRGGVLQLLKAILQGVDPAVEKKSKRKGGETNFCRILSGGKNSKKIGWAIKHVFLYNRSVDIPTMKKNKK